MKKLLIISAIALSVALNYSFVKPIKTTITIDNSYEYLIQENPSLEPLGRG